MPNFAIEKESFKRYGFTLRKTKLQKTKKEKFSRSELTDIYHQRIKDFKDLGATLQDYEFEDTAGLHVHGIIDVPRQFNMKRLTRRGWSVLLKEVFDHQGWLAYMTKDKVDPGNWFKQMGLAPSAAQAISPASDECLNIEVKSHESESFEEEQVTVPVKSLFK